MHETDHSCVFGNADPKRKRDRENTGFKCANCSYLVSPLSNGSYRNHCPSCLYSLHLDAVIPGDRLGSCGGLMEPIGLMQSRKGKGFQLVHRCTNCGLVRKNIVALDSPSDQDSIEALTRLPILLSSQK
jgi:DNA-directed RNA polymerase subunit RPC12/RpoP